MKKDDFKNFVGIDVSKLTLDLALISHEKQAELPCIQVTNDKPGMKQMIRWIRRFGLKIKDVLFCLEHTGVYGIPVQHFLIEQGAFVWVEMPVQIIRSIGLQRGKNDEVDAKRIAAYAMRFQSERKNWTPPTQEQTEIKDLMNLRAQLINMKIALIAPVNELMAMSQTNRAKDLRSACQRTLKSIESDLEKVENQIGELIKKDAAVEKNVRLITSIPGIGIWTALEVVDATDNFSRLTDARQLACYCGCAPFEHRSGTSVRGKTRVSHMANKRLKTLLTLCARSIIRSKNEMAEYYHRKVAEGKNKMSVINALHNKLIHRIVAVIQRQSPYLRSLNEMHS